KEMVRLQASLAHGSRAEELRPKTATSLRAEEASEASSVWSDQGPRQTRESSDGSWELLRPGMPWECETHLTLVVLTVECYKLLHRCHYGLDAAGRTRSPTASSAESCIRKADGARGEAALGHGLADARFCTRRIGIGWKTQ